MFKQITNLNGDEIYLITSLWIFLVFFVAVALMLFWMKKDHIQYMKELPLDGQDEQNGQTTE
ncbi:hypothetical protein ACR78F_10590 [Sphingobacterium spiritivorum]|uniref:Cbb3-type cytochrome oxidase component FixQ n=3 Tax=Sphingobacterium spiritivorum TaxID=258 RepID=D7VKV0_SPHSI|nr:MULTISPECIES: hypothetical protein [Sphingobacterium]EEI89522.1 hypothetical protein HMPREF0765_4889 [Sphingobacterium spiritivorum ATCC 33300]EFK58902.1 hypothetical protein HMPREF0766_11619 [Sphingobacterium spiritivorum ATCC 33861]QQS94526.1 hypothetical protein I6J03_14125 [Sphingobacterium spiritivorum]QQT24523.1 hypothetical protein I6J02_12255 [Sphingobacterium spiritivorum]QQT34224.1 hypothetical protein I6J01_12845 [Sphingobacterium spiritivorum]